MEIEKDLFFSFFLLLTGLVWSGKKKIPRTISVRRFTRFSCERKIMDFHKIQLEPRVK